MELSVTHHIDAPIDRVWALQLDHEHWPDHLPNFSRVVRQAPDEPFGVGSIASVTQPALGTVEWTVTAFEEAPERRSFSWVGASRGIRYAASHLVEARPDGGTQLTLGITATGTAITLLGWMLKGQMKKAVAAEAVAFEQWATRG
ncbi:MAG: SRPBCC family protein [Actinobacteria bacterium]|nr:SRPBCC family protein [Actinomycetota bacterium]